MIHGVSDTGAINDAKRNAFCLWISVPITSVQFYAKPTKEKCPDVGYSVLICTACENHVRTLLTHWRFNIMS